MTVAMSMGLTVLPIICSLLVRSCLQSHIVLVAYCLLLSHSSAGTMKQVEFVFSFIKCFVGCGPVARGSEFSIKRNLQFSFHLFFSKFQLSCPRLCVRNFHTYNTSNLHAITHVANMVSSSICVAN